MASVLPRRHWLHAAAAASRLRLRGGRAAAVVELQAAVGVRLHHAELAEAARCAAPSAAANCQAHWAAGACRLAACCCFAAEMALLPAACPRLHATAAAVCTGRAAPAGGRAEAPQTGTARWAGVRPRQQLGTANDAEQAGKTLGLLHGCRQGRCHCSDAPADLAGVPLPLRLLLPQPLPLWLQLLPTKAALAALLHLQCTSKLVS